MKPNPNFNPGEAHVEAYVDGALPEAEQEAFARACAADPVLADAVQRAEAVIGALRTLPPTACPDFVTDAVFARIRDEKRAARSARWQGWLRGFTASLWRPALAAAVVAALVLTVTLSRPERYSEQEVAQAAEDLRLVLSVLGEVGERTGQIVTKDVLGEEVARPLQRAFDREKNPDINS